jgi:hypothetical protein
MDEMETDCSYGFFTVRYFVEVPMVVKTVSNIMVSCEKESLISEESIKSSFSQAKNITVRLMNNK